MIKSTKAPPRQDDGVRGCDRQGRSSHALARIIGLGLAPFAHQLFKVRVVPLGQHDPHRGEQIAFSLFRGKALALEAKGTPGTSAGTNVQLDRAIERRHAHLGPEHRLVERDRKLEPQIRAGARKQRMRRDRDGDEKVAGTAAGAGESLPFQADGLALVQSGGDLDVDLPASRELHALVRALGRFRQRDRKRSGDVLAGAAQILLLELEAAARSSRTSGASERFLQDILEAAEAAKTTAAAAGLLKAITPPAEGFENALRAEAALPATMAESLKALESRLAFGVDLAAIESLALALLA